MLRHNLVAETLQTELFELMENLQIVSCEKDSMPRILRKKGLILGEK